MPIREILLKYWGYDAFRPMQEDIINSVLAGRDTLALLPTGGGKSLCFQVPALAMDGLCLVVSPLIALMKDQVHNLRKRGIQAFAVYSGMNRHETEVVLNNCAFGRAKFLYLSPERLESAEFLQHLVRWKVCLIAVDEAHCISQWGYDFRPPYLRIAAVRVHFPQVPVLALTATATAGVIEDIQQKLGFRQQQVFRKSFFRENLAYLVLHEEDKRGRLQRIADRTKGSGIVYVRNRKKTREIALWLRQQGMTATWYHAGLDAATRSQRQDDWMSGKERVVVATNAFGMGIDKPDVRFVVHLDLPESPEAYFQEAGRAGRDGKPSYSVILWEQADVTNLKSAFTLSYPEPEFIRKVYRLLGTFARIPEGGGKDTVTDFNIREFCRQYRLPVISVYKAVSFLEKEGYIRYDTDEQAFSSLFMNASREELYRFQVAHPGFDALVKVILRSYGGLFTEFAPVREADLALRSEMEVSQLVEKLNQLQQMRVLTYLPAKTQPQLVFCRERADEKHILVNRDNYFRQKDQAGLRIEAMVRYVTGSDDCRSVALLSYFGEEGVGACGQCDVCLKRKNRKDGVEKASEALLALITGRKVRPEELPDLLPGLPEEDLFGALRWLGDQGKIITDSSGCLQCKPSREQRP